MSWEIMINDGKCITTLNYTSSIQTKMLFTCQAMYSIRKAFIMTEDVEYKWWANTYAHKVHSEFNIIELNLTDGMCITQSMVVAK